MALFSSSCEAPIVPNALNAFLVGNKIKTDVHLGTRRWLADGFPRREGHVDNWFKQGVPPVALTLWLR